MRILVIQHVADEGLGLLEYKLLQNNWKLDIKAMHRPDTILPTNLDQHHAMIILGGPMSANDVAMYSYFRQVEELVREAALRNIPTLGICLGAQLVARALGAHVGPNVVKEIGWLPIVVEPRGQVSRLFQQLPPMFSVFQWHTDTFTLPTGAVLLASSEKCRHQAFRYEKNIWGIQFHLEVTLEMIKTWCLDYSRELNEFGGPGAAENLLRNTQARWGPMQAWREQFLDNVVEVLKN